jgi:hypothetical protein
VQALEKFNIEKDIAAYIKKEFDKKYNPTWHCIVGRNFGERRRAPGPRRRRPRCSSRRADARGAATAGSYVTHETKHFIYFYLGERRRWRGWRPCQAAIHLLLRLLIGPRRLSPARRAPRRPGSHPALQERLSKERGAGAGWQVAWFNHACNLYSGPPPGAESTRREREE